MLILFIWLLISLLVIGTPCLLMGLIYQIFRTERLHRQMWWWYNLWGRQLGWLTQYYVPKLEYKGEIYSESVPFVLISNHYCWLDILILFATVFQKRPFVFVMKKSLFYVPMIGVISSVLGYPLVDRGRAGRKNKAVLINSAQKAKAYNYGIVIFPEGTRRVKAKDGNSEYKHLLQPKWVGLDRIVGQLGSEVCVLDASIAYEKDRPNLWDLLLGSVGKVKIEVKEDTLLLEDIKSWLLDRWAKKDFQLEIMRSQM